MDISKELEGQYLPDSRSRGSVQSAYTRLEKAYNGGNITQEEFRELYSRIAEIQAAMDKRSREQRKAGKETFKSEREDVDWLKGQLLQGDPHPYPIFTIRSIVNHLKRHRQPRHLRPILLNIFSKSSHQNL